MRPKLPLPQTVIFELESQALQYAPVFGAPVTPETPNDIGPLTWETGGHERLNLVDQDFVPGKDMFKLFRPYVSILKHDDGFDILGRTSGVTSGVWISTNAGLYDEFCESIQNFRKSLAASTQTLFCAAPTVTIADEIDEMNVTSNHGDSPQM